jgi:hypothetical protein
MIKGRPFSDGLNFYSGTEGIRALRTYGVGEVRGLAGFLFIIIPPPGGAS